MTFLFPHGRDAAERPSAMLAGVASGLGRFRKGQVSVYDGGLAAK